MGVPVLVDLGAVPGTASVVMVPAQNPAPPPGEGEEFGKASPVALVVIVLLGLATVLLVRSMSKRIRRLPTSFDKPGETPEEGAELEADRPVERGADDAGAGRP